MSGFRLHRRYLAGSKREQVRERKMREEIVPFVDLVDWPEGRLSPAASDEARRTAGWLHAFQEMSDEIVLAAPLAGVRQELEARFATLRQPGLWQRLAATLTFDSMAQPAAADVRSAAVQEEERQLVYRSDVADIALNICHQTGEAFTIVGQVFPLGEAATERPAVQLLRDTVTEEAITSPDERGEFVFRSVPPGSYDVVLSSGEWEVVISPLELRQVRTMTTRR